MSAFNIEKSIVTGSRCFKIGEKIEPIGLMIHSVGTPQPDPQVFRDIWNKITSNACVHAVIGASRVIQCLPWNMRGWHARLSANNTHIGAEMTEPNSIRYIGTGSQFIDDDPIKTKAHVMATYANAVKLFAVLCTMHNFDPLKEGVIESHASGYKRGIASNHGDPEHLWNKFGLSLKQFRVDIKNAMEDNDEVDEDRAEVVKQASGRVKVIYDGNDGLNVRESATFEDDAIVRVVKAGEVFTVIGITDDKKFYKLKSGLFITTDERYVDFLADFTPYTVKVNVSVLNVRREPNTKADIVGIIRKGEIFTIVGEQNGWGRLKSGLGWISTTYVDKVLA